MMNQKTKVKKQITIRTFRSRWETVGLIVLVLFFSLVTVPVLFLFDDGGEHFVYIGVVDALVLFCIGKSLFAYYRTYIQYDSEEITLSEPFKKKRILMRNLRQIQEIPTENYRLYRGGTVQTIEERAWDFVSSNGFVFRSNLNLTHRDPAMKKLFNTVRRVNKNVQFCFLEK